MDSTIAEGVTLIMAVNAAAVALMIILAFVGSAVALEALSKVDAWMRVQDDKRLSQLIRSRGSQTPSKDSPIGQI